MTAIKYGDRFADLRYDGIDLELVPQEIQGADGIPDPDDPNGEFHEVVLIKGTNGKYGFSPNEMPFRNTALVDSGIVVYEVDSSNVATGSPLTQVRPAVGTQPGLTEYAVDFNNAFPYLNTGRFFFNPANVGKFYRIHRYFGIGGLNSVANTKAVEQAVLNTKLSRDGSLAMIGHLNMGNKKINLLADGSLSTDAVNKGQLSAAVSNISLPYFSHPDTLDGSGNLSFVIPISGTFFVIISGGGAPEFSGFSGVGNNRLGFASGTITTSTPGTPGAPVFIIGVKVSP